VPRNPADAPPLVVDVYQRAGCHLCDVALPGVREIAARHGAEVRVLDIEERDDWVRDYGLLIPVVAVDDEQVSVYRLDAGALETALRRAARRRRPRGLGRLLGS
jgi:hypothetical protein